jgi:O-antigen/teichoic acid export membrane protein
VSEVFKYASFTLLSAAGGILLTTMDGIFITYFRSLTEVGLYQAALPIASLFLVFVDPLIAFLAPVVVERHHAGAHQDISAILSSIYKFGVFLLVPFTLFFVIFSREILLVLFGPDYVLAAPALVLLSFALFFRALQSINFAFLYGTGRIKVQFTIMWICVALNVLLDFLFVPRWGFVAAAAATLVSFLLMFLISFFVLKRHFTFASSWFRNLVKILVLAGLSLLLIAFLKSLLSLSLYFAAALIGCLFLIFYFGIGIFILKIVEWQELLSLLRQLISLLRGKLAAVTHR